MSVARRVKLMAHNLFFGNEQDIHGSYNAMKMINTEHERIHAGKCWYSQGHGTQTAGATRYMLIRVADTELHVRDFGIKTNQGPFTGALYEAPFIDINSLGTLTPFRNLNRSSVNSCSTLLYNAPFADINSLGEEIDYGTVFETAGGAIKQISGALSTVVVEWVLKPNTDYVAAFVNSSTSDADFTQHILGYEP